MNQRISLLKVTSVAFLAVAALALTPSMARAQAPAGSLWYNGDADGVSALANEENTTVGQASVYEDFDVTAPVWNITSVFSDDLLTTNVTAVSYEIRTGISEGNGGTLLFSGTTSNYTVTATGRSAFGYTEYMVQANGLSIVLPALPLGQHYWLNVTPIGDGTGRSFNTTTSGMNAVGSPPGNDQNSFLNSADFGTNFLSTGADYSNGVIGTAIPEPGTWSLLAGGLGMVLAAYRRRRSG
jgi:hypothetical protein